MDGQVNPIESGVVQKAKELGIFNAEPGVVRKAEDSNMGPEELAAQQRLLSASMTPTQPVKKEVTHEQLKQALLVLTEGVMRLDDKADALQLAVDQLAETIEDLATDLREDVFGRDFGGRDDV